MYNSNCSFENGGIAQLARACGSYPQCPRFESRCRYHKRRSLNTAPFIRPVGQAVKTPPFHGGNMGSIPVRVTKKQKPTEWWAFAFCNLRRESKGAGVNDMPVACQSRDLARPQARIPVRVTKKARAHRMVGFCFLQFKKGIEGSRRRITQMCIYILLNWRFSGKIKLNLIVEARICRQ